MKEALHFAVFIQSDRAQVWDTMLGPETYNAWTAAFCEGSRLCESMAANVKMGAA